MSGASVGNYMPQIYIFFYQWRPDDVVIQERYKPVPLGVNATYKFPDGAQDIAGFSCATSGTITVTNQRGLVILNAYPVTAGVYHPFPYSLEQGNGASAVLAGGASGTLAVG